LSAVLSKAISEDQFITELGNRIQARLASVPTSDKPILSTLQTLRDDITNLIWKHLEKALKVAPRPHRDMTGALIGPPLDPNHRLP
jgi:hypothetical protein